MEVKEAQPLLDEALHILEKQRIIESYEKPDFNVFAALQAETDEVRTHSRMIRALIDPKASHGLGETMLKLLLKEFEISTEEDLSKATVQLEYYIGSVTKEKGGSIDILIRLNDAQQTVVMIENKIYATEQPNQLLRYHNAFPNAKLVYLTLEGDDSKKSSSNDIDYLRVSYRDNICNWLEGCEKEATKQHALREIIAQYLYTIKKLTNQTMNSVSQEEWIQLFESKPEYFDLYGSLTRVQENLKKKLVKRVLYELKERAKSDLAMRGEFSVAQKADQVFNRYSKLCAFSTEAMRKKNIEIRAEYQNKNLNGLIVGFVRRDKSVDMKTYEDNLEDVLREASNNATIKKTSGWVYFEYKGFMNASTNVSVLKKYSTGELVEDVIRKIELIRAAYENMSAISATSRS